MKNVRFAMKAAIAVLAFAGSAEAADGPLVIAGARVVTVSGAVLENASIIIENGRIASVGSGLTAPAGARIIDGKGKTVYPGLFDALTTLGLAEVTDRQRDRDGCGQIARPGQRVRPDGSEGVRDR
jgi:imidazolonepropionase-like amidohydrolase